MNPHRNLLMKIAVEFMQCIIVRTKSHLKKIIVKLLISLFVISLNTKQSYATCNFRSPSVVLNLIRENHPNLSVNALTNEVFKQRVNVAEQQPNPELDLNVDFGEDSDGDKMTASMDYKHVFELGDKRNARIDLARKEYHLKVAENIANHDDVIVKAVVDLYRLSQISKSIHLYKDAFNLFTEILGAKRKITVMSPEEEVAINSLDLAASDYQLKIEQLVSEKNYLNRYISYIAGINCEIPSVALPAGPKLDKQFNSNENIEKSSNLLAAKNALAFAKANLNYENSMAYSDLKIGPTYEFETNYTDDFQTIGLALTMDLPILSRNAAGKRVAVKNISLAQKKYVKLRNENENNLELWIDKYNRYSKSLKEIERKKELIKKHQNIERMFKRGIVSTSLVIESNRQLLDYTDTLNELELGVVEALWNIYKLTGAIKSKNI